MAVVTQYYNFDYMRPPVSVGVKIDTTNPDPTTALTRCFTDIYGIYSEGTTVNNIFKVNTATSPYVSTFDTFNSFTNLGTGGPGLMPWVGMRRCSIAYSGDISSYRGDLDDYGNPIYTEASTSKIMVEIPKFWHRFYKSGNYFYMFISPYPLQNYRLFPAFIRQKAPVDSIFIGAFESYETGSLLYSGVGNIPTISNTRPTNRTAADSVNNISGGGQIQKWSLPDIQAWSALQWLYLIEYACLDSQTPSGSTARGGLGPGVNSGTIALTGWTSGHDNNVGGYHSVDLGNSSGQVQIDASRYVNCYRGVENIFGHTWMQLDCNCIDTNRNLWIDYNLDSVWNKPTDMTTAQLVAASNTTFQQTGRQMPSAGTAGFFHSLAYDAAYHEPEWALVPNAIDGSATTYFADYIDAPSVGSECYWCVGGSITNGNQDGIFAINMIETYTSASADIASRLMFVPYFNRDTALYKYL